MEDNKKTKAQLITEMQELRGKIEQGKSEKGKRILIGSNDERKVHQVWETYSHSPISSIVLSRLGKIVAYNNAMKELTGYDHTEVADIEAWLSKLFPDEKYRNYVIDVSRKSRQREVDVISEKFVITRKDGEKRTVELFVTDIVQDGKPIDFQIIQGIDISERKLMEKTLRESEENYRGLFENSMIGISQALPDGRLINANEAYVRMYGYESLEEMMAEICHVGHQLYAYPEDRKEILRILKEKGVMEPREIAVIKRDGTRFFVLAGAHEVRDSEGNLLYYQAEHIDITERKRVKELLKEVSLYARSLIEASLDPLVTINAEGRITDVNTATEKVTGISRERLIGSDFVDYFTEPEMARAGYLKVFQAGQIIDYPLAVRHTSGAIIEVLYNASIYRNEQGEVLGVFAAARDITEQKRVEEELRESEGFLRDLFENMTSGAAIYKVINDGSKGSDYIIRDFNATSLRIEGMRKDEVIGKSLFDLRPNIDQFGLIPIFQNVWRTGEPGYFPSSVYIDEKYTSWYENRIFKLPTGEIVAIYDDITERRRMEEELRESEKRYRSLYNQIPDLYLSLNPRGEIIECNSLGAQKIGYSVDELIGRQMKSLLTEESIRKYNKEFPQLLKSGKLLNAERSIIAKNGQIHNLILNAEVYYDADGNPLRTRAILRDITDIRKAEIQLREDKEKLRSLAMELTAIEDRERRKMAEYLHDMISQALVVIKMKLGILQELKDSKTAVAVNKEINELLEQAIESTRSITFELSSPILEKLGFEPAVEWLCEKMAEDHGLAIEFRSDSSKKELNGDIERFLYRSIRELLMNVVKHAHAHRVKVTVFKKKGYICITVDDDGVGFRENMDSNWHLDRGFGLFSIHERLDHIGGRMEIDSKPGHGTSVSLSWKERRRSKNRSNHEN